MKRKRLIPVILLAAFLIGSMGFNVTNSVAAKKKVFKLTFSTAVPSTGFGAKNTMQPWFDQVKKLTDGQVVIEPYWSTSLVKEKAVWGAMKSGIVDVCDVSFHYMHGLIVYHNVMTLPFLKYQSAEHEATVAWKLYEQFPEIRDEYKENKLLLLYTSTPFVFVSNKKQIKTLDDFKGLKIRVAGGESLKSVVEAGGGIPTRIPGTEIYSALEKGVIDASMANWDMIMTFRFYEVTKYYFYGPWNAGAKGVAMSWQAWNRLPADLQQKILSISEMKGSRYWTRTTFDESVAAGKQSVKSKGYKNIESKMTTAQVDKMRALHGDKIWNIWIHEAEKKAKATGHPDPKGLVQKILATTQELIATTAK